MKFKMLYGNLLHNTLLLHQRSEPDASDPEEHAIGQNISLSPEALYTRGCLRRVENLRINVAAVTGILFMSLHADGYHTFDGLERTLLPVMVPNLHMIDKYRIQTETKCGVYPNEISPAMHKLSVTLSRRIYSRSQPIVTAAWTEYEIIRRIRPYPRANDRMARAFSAWALLKMESPLPIHLDQEAYYVAMDAGPDAFLDYYRTCRFAHL